MKGFKHKFFYKNNTLYPFTLSTPALRMKFPFLFHLRANMGPLCCPKVLARFPRVNTAGHSSALHATGSTV